MDPIAVDDGAGVNVGLVDDIGGGATRRRTRGEGRHRTRHQAQSRLGVGDADREQRHIAGIAYGEAVRERVVKAREIQEERFKENEGVYANAQMGSKLLRSVCVIPDEGTQLLKTAMERLGLSARAFDRILKVSRTIADLAGSEDIKTEHLAEAIQYRSLDRDGWAG